MADHVRSILRKSGCANRTEAAAYAYRRGLVQRPRALALPMPIYMIERAYAEELDITADGSG